MTLQRKGEIATIITIGVLIVLGLTSIISSKFLSQNNQTTKTLAAGLRCPGPNCDQCGKNGFCGTGCTGYPTCGGVNTLNCVCPAAGQDGYCDSTQHRWCGNDCQFHDELNFTKGCQISPPPASSPPPSGSGGATCSGKIDSWYCAGECANQGTRDTFTSFCHDNPKAANCSDPSLRWRSEKAGNCGFNNVSLCPTHDCSATGAGQSYCTAQDGTKYQQGHNYCDGNNLMFCQNNNGVGKPVLQQTCPNVCDSVNQVCTGTSNSPPAAPPAVPPAGTSTGGCNGTCAETKDMCLTGSTFSPDDNENQFCKSQFPPASMGYTSGVCCNASNQSPATNGTCVSAGQCPGTLTSIYQCQQQYYVDTVPPANTTGYNSFDDACNGNGGGVNGNNGGAGAAGVNQNSLSVTGRIRNVSDLINIGSDLSLNFTPDPKSNGVTTDIGKVNDDGTFTFTISNASKLNSNMTCIINVLSKLANATVGTLSYPCNQNQVNLNLDLKQDTLGGDLNCALGISGANSACDLLEVLQHHPLKVYYSADFDSFGSKTDSVDFKTLPGQNNWFWSTWKWRVIYTTYSAIDTGSLTPKVLEDTRTISYELQ